MGIVAEQLVEELSDDRAELLFLQTGYERLFDDRRHIGLLDMGQRVGEDP